MTNHTPGAMHREFAAGCEPEQFHGCELHGVRYVDITPATSAGAGPIRRLGHATAEVFPGRQSKFEINVLRDQKRIIQGG